jgi:rRNA maturation RNase YbeY
MPRLIKPAVEFHFLEKCQLTDRLKLKEFLITLFRLEKERLESLSYIFCSDDYLLEINRAYLKHNFYTDIVTFDLSDKDSGITGEIYISVERVRDNADQLGLSFKSEIHRVIFHGALHLCGFKDKSKADKLLMTKMEDKYLKKYLS